MSKLSQRLRELLARSGHEPGRLISFNEVRAIETELLNLVTNNAEVIIAALEAAEGKS